MKSIGTLQKIPFLNNIKAVYVLLLLFVLLDRIFIYIHFNSNFVGNDDLIFWQGATDYLKGDFYSPYFYGQNYNVMLESFFAIPFLKLGLSFPLAFFIATSSISLFPFLFFSFVLFKRKYTSEALFFLIIPLLLPIEYGIITSMSRGFVNGLFFSGFFIFSLLNPEKKGYWVITALATSIGYVVNPSIVIVAFPLYIYLLFINFRKVSFYLYSILAVAPALAWEIIAQVFYAENPEYLLNPLMELKFNLSLFLKSFHQPTIFFGYLTPVIWPVGWLILFIILFIGIRLLKLDFKKGVAILSTLLFIILTLGINKVHTYMDSIFLPASRMYLGIPIFTGIIFFWSRSLLTKITDRQLQFSLLSAAFLAIFLKLFLYTSTVNKHTASTVYGGVSIIKLEDLKCDCDKIKQIAINKQIDLVVPVATWYYGSVSNKEFINYGCSILEEDFPTTMLNIYEKRSWVKVDVKNWPGKNILFYGTPKDMNKLRTIENCEIIDDNPDHTIFIINNNTLGIDALLDKVGVNY